MYFAKKQTTLSKLDQRLSKIATNNKGDKPMNKRVQQQGTERNSRKDKTSKHRWVLGCSVLVVSAFALNLVVEYADFHDLARDYHHSMQDGAQKRMQVLSLVTAQAEN